MRIVHVTAGTGGWYCGTCIRDNALVRGLRALGHDAMLVPLYLPIVGEGSDESAEVPVFFGGINCFVQQFVPLARRIPGWMDRFLDARPVLALAARRAGMTRPEGTGPLTLSMLQGPDGNQAKEIERLADWLLEGPPIDAVVLSNAMLAGMAGRLRHRLGVPVLVTLQGEMYYLDQIDEPWRSQAWDELRRRIRAADGLIAVSDFCAEAMADRLGLPRQAIPVVHNGLDPEGFGPADGPPEVPTIGYLARLAPEKGLATLVEAFIRLRKRPDAPEARLHLGGARIALHDPLVRGLVHHLAEAGLTEDVTWAPDLSPEAKRDFLRGLSVLSVPTARGDTFGTYVVEAMASGVPVVAPEHGAAPEILAQVPGGLLFPPDDVDALADALLAVLTDTTLRDRLVADGHRALEHFSLRRMAQGVADVVEAATRPELRRTAP